MIQRVCSLLRMQPPVILDRGLLFASGSVVPTDGTDKYQTGCLFQHTDGGAGTALYVNEGTVTSCAFKAVDAGEIDVSLDVGEFSSLEAGSGIAISSSNTSAVAIFGDDNGLSIASSVYNLRSRMLLTVDQAGASIRGAMGQLKLINGVDVQTGIYTGVQGYIELVGTHSAKTGSTFSCIDASLEIGTALTVDSGGEACGIHVETTGSGTITNNGTCAAVLIDKATGAANWPYGVYVVGETTHQAFVAGVQGTGVYTTTTYPFAVEIHNEANADIVAGNTGSSAGIYNRYEIATAQTSQCNHISVFAKLRPKANMADGVHCGVYGLVEASETITLSGTSTTLTAAAHFALDFGANVTVSAGHVNGVCIDSSINASADLTSATLAGLRFKKSGTCKAWTTGIVIEANASTTGIDIGACTTGLAITGACSTAAVNITAANLNCIKSVFNIDSGLGQYVQGIKMEHTRSANIQPSTGGWWGAQIVLNAGTGYDALDKTAYVLHCVFKGDATNPSSQTVNVGRFETQSDGKVEDLLFVSANSGSTVTGDVARFVTHVAPTRSILAVQNGTTGSTPIGICVDIDETMTTGIQFNTGAAITNLLQITAAANTSYFLIADAEAGCLPNYASAGTAIANLKVKIGDTDGYIKIYDAA